MIHLNIYESIQTLLDFPSQLSFLFICSIFKNNLPVTKLCDIAHEHLIKIDANVLKYFFCYAKELDISCVRLTDISFMENLRLLNAGKSMYTSEKNFHDISSLLKLRILYAAGECGITDDSIKILNLTKL